MTTLTTHSKKRKQENSQTPEAREKERLRKSPYYQNLSPAEKERRKKRRKEKRAADAAALASSAPAPKPTTIHSKKNGPLWTTPNGYPLLSPPYVNRRKKPVKFQGFSVSTTSPTHQHGPPSLPMPPPPLKHVDVFTGLAGFPLALKHVKSIAGRQIKTIRYCEINPDSRAVLLKAMASGHIQDAPIEPDVLDLDYTDPDFKNLGLLTAGFPCRGTSFLGERGGLNNEHTKYLSNLFDFIERTKPLAVILENPPGVISTDDVMMKIKTKFATNGYHTVYLTMAAAAIGALHERERWFCLAIRPDELFKYGDQLVIDTDVAQYDFEGEKVEGTKIPRVFTPSSPAERASAEIRMEGLGNCLVPLQGFAAIAALWSGCQKPLETIMKSKTIMFRYPIIDVAMNAAETKRSKNAYAKLEKQKYIQKKGKKIVLHNDPYKAGYIVPGSRSVCLHINIDKMKLQRQGFERVNLTFKAKRNDGNWKIEPAWSDTWKDSPYKPIVKDVTKKLWATPCGNTSTANYFTVGGKTAGNIHNQISWEDKTPEQKPGEPKHMTNPNFIEHLMGYPQDYTKVP